MTIEELFPLKSIRLLAKIESQRRQFYRPIYSLHKSFARRPGTTIRAIGLSHFSNEPIFNNEDLEKSKFYQNHDFSDKIVLDPFSGGGTSIVELHRLGAKTIGIDINPMAWWTTYKELDSFDPIKYDKEAKKLAQTIGRKIKSFYHTVCPECKYESADIMYTFWVRTINCPSCSSKEDLFKYYIIGKRQRNNPSTMVICPQCNQLFYTLKDLNDICLCSRCNHKFIPRLGNCRLKNFICTSCSKKFRLIDLLREGKQPLSARQIAIEYYCSKCKTRGYKAVTKHDIANYQNIKEQFRRIRNNLHYPDQYLPQDGKNIENLRNYGFKKFTDLFNARQLLSLGLILKSISKISDEKTKEYFLTAFSSCLEFHTTICPYNYTMKQIVNVFNYQSFLVPTQYVENNIWGTKKGNGTFITYIKKIRSAKMYCKSPFEISVKENKIKRISIAGDIIEARGVMTFQDLLNSRDNETLLLSDSSENLGNLGIPANSIDLIITDPPYYDYIQYSELSNFFYVWLRIHLKSKYSVFKSKLIHSENEIGIKKKREPFINKLSKVFIECNQVLKDNGILVFTFHHSSAAAWAMILDVLRNSTFRLTKVFSIYSEFKARPVSGENFDFILVCRKNFKEVISINPVILENIETEVDRLIGKHRKSNIISNGITLKEKVFGEILPVIARLVFANPNLNSQSIIENIFNRLDEKE